MPPWLIENAVRDQPNARLLRYARFDHRCCWQRAWPAMLERLE